MRAFVKKLRRKLGDVATSPAYIMTEPRTTTGALRRHHSDVPPVLRRELSPKGTPALAVLDPDRLRQTDAAPGSRAKSRAAHTDLMDNCERVFDELVVWRQSAQRDPRGPIQSEDRSNMSPDPMYWFNRVFVPALKRRVFMVGNLPDILYDAVTPFLGSTADGIGRCEVIDTKKS